MRTFLGEKCKIATLGHTIFIEMFLYKLQFTCYLYDAANWKHNLSFKILRTVDFYSILKIGIFVKHLTIFENRLKTQFNANVHAF